MKFYQCKVRFGRFVKKKKALKWQNKFTFFKLKYHTSTHSQENLRIQKQIVDMQIHVV